MIERILNYFGYYKVDVENTEAWIKQYVDENIVHTTTYQNDAQWWEEYSKSHPPIAE